MEVEPVEELADQDASKEEEETPTTDVEYLNLKVKLKDGSFGYIFSTEVVGKSTRWNCHLCGGFVFQEDLQKHVVDVKHLRNLENVTQEDTKSSFMKVEDGDPEGGETGVEDNGPPEVTEDENLADGVKEEGDCENHVNEILESVPDSETGPDVSQESPKEDLGSEHDCAPEINMEVSDVGSGEVAVKEEGPTEPYTLWKDEVPRIRATLEEIQEVPLVGLEYFVEMTDSEETKYVCLLCPDKRPIQVSSVEAHASNPNHRAKYLGLHFPKVNVGLSYLLKTTKLVQRNVYFSVMEKVCSAIESKYGRMYPKVMDKATFLQNKLQCLQMMLASSHLGNTDEDNFEEVVLENVSAEYRSGVQAALEDSEKCQDVELTEVASIQKTLDTYGDGPLVGLEYLAEIVGMEKTTALEYCCTLCEKFGGSQPMVWHFGCDNHRANYLMLHFPTSTNILSSLPKNTKGEKQAFSSYLKEVCNKIERKYGRIGPMVVSKKTFDRDRLGMLNKILAQSLRESEDDDFVVTVDLTLSSGEDAEHPTVEAPENASDPVIVVSEVEEITVPHQDEEGGKAEESPLIMSILESHKDTSLIGLEYLVEVVYHKYHDYYCMLCPDRKALTGSCLVRHLTSNGHRCKYLSLHFPAVSRVIAHLPKTTTVDKVVYSSTLEKLCDSIEKRGGRLQPKLAGKEFEVGKLDCLREMLEGPHLREMPGEDLAAEVLANLDENLRKEIQENLQQEDAPPPPRDDAEGDAPPVAQIQSTLDAHQDGPLVGLEYLVEVAHPAQPPEYSCVLCDKQGGAVSHLTCVNHRVCFLALHFPSAAKALARLPRGGRREKATHVAAVTDVCAAIEARYGRLRPTVTDRRGFLADKEELLKAVLRQSFREEAGAGCGDAVEAALAKHQLDAKRHRRNDDEDGSSRRKARERMDEELHRFKEESREKLKQYRAAPKDHPRYEEERTRFCEDRAKRMRDEGDDPDAVDLEPEWSDFWDRRMRTLQDEMVKKKSDELWHKYKTSSSSSGAGESSSKRRRRDSPPRHNSSSRFSRDRQPSRFNRDGSSSRFGRNDRFNRDGPPNRFGRDGPASRLDRDDPPSRFNREGPASRFDDPPAPRFNRDGPASRFDRGDAPSRFERDEAPPSRFGRDEPPAPRFNRDGPQSRFNRDEPQARFNREGPQSRFNREGPQSRFNRDGPQSRFARDEAPARFGVDQPNRFNRDGPASRFNREEPASRFGADEAPQRFNRDDQPARPNREGGPPSRFNREGEPPSRFNRDGPPSRFNRDEPPARFMRDDQPSRFSGGDDQTSRFSGGDEAPARFTTAGDEPPARFNRDGPRFNRDEAPSRFNREEPSSRFNRDQAPSRFNRDDAEEPTSRFNRDAPPPSRFNANEQRFNKNDSRPNFNRDEPPPRFGMAEAAPAEEGGANFGYFPSRFDKQQDAAPDMDVEMTASGYADAGILASFDANRPPPPPPPPPAYEVDQGARFQGSEPPPPPQFNREVPPPPLAAAASTGRDLLAALDCLIAVEDAIGCLGHWVRFVKTRAVAAEQQRPDASLALLAEDQSAVLLEYARLRLRGQRFAGAAEIVAQMDKLLGAGTSTMAQRAAMALVAQGKPCVTPQEVNDLLAQLQQPQPPPPQAPVAVPPFPPPGMLSYATYDYYAAYGGQTYQQAAPAAAAAAAAAQWPSLVTYPLNYMTGRPM